MEKHFKNMEDYNHFVHDELIPNGGTIECELLAVKEDGTVKFIYHEVVEHNVGILL